ncbi:hypothetical protein [Streptomyces sp. NPDC005969]
MSIVVVELAAVLLEGAESAEADWRRAAEVARAEGLAVAGHPVRL